MTDAAIAGPRAALLWPGEGTWAEALEEIEGPFVWRERDCVTALGQVIGIATGVDPFAEMQEWEYDDAASAVRLAKEMGGLRAVVGRFLPETTGRLRSGMLVLGPGEPDVLRTFGGPPLAIVIGTGLYAKADAHGFYQIGSVMQADDAARWLPVRV